MGGLEGIEGYYLDKKEVISPLLEEVNFLHCDNYRNVWARIVVSPTSENLSFSRRRFPCGYWNSPQVDLKMTSRLLPNVSPGIIRLQFAKILKVYGIVNK